MMQLIRPTLGHRKSLDKIEHIQFVSHDDEDGMWQFLCGRKHKTEDARLVSLESIFKIDNSVGELADMPCGHQAERDTENSIWDVRYIEQYNVT